MVDQREEFTLVVTDKTDKIWYAQPAIWMKVLAFMVFMFGGVSLFAPSTVSAASITGSPKLSIPNSSTEIGSDYTFVPTFGEDSSVTTFGSSKWRKIDRNKEGRTNWDHQWWGIDLNNEVSSNANLKGDVGVKYTKVGSYNGQELDLVITLTGWGAYFEKTGNISFNTTDIEMYSQGYNAVDMEWRYVKSGTSTEVNVSGYLTFGDIDAAQGIRFSNATSSKISQVMIPSSNSKLLYTTYSGGYWYYVDSDYDTPEADRSPLYRFTILYAGQSRLALTWTVNYANQGFSSRTAAAFNSNYNTTRANGQFFYYEYDKPARTAIAKPTKTVSTDNMGSESSEQTIENIYNTTKFVVNHSVPKEPSKYFFTNYKMTDTLHKGMVPTGTVLIKNASGKNVTSWFDINKNGQTITASAKATTLKNNAFYGGTYHFIIDAKSVSADKYDEFVSGDKAVVTNTATITVNGKNYSSNQVKANMYRRNITVKHVDKDTGALLATESEKRYDGETPTYAPRSDLKDADGQAYRSLTANQKITVSKDQTITFYYDSPRKITVNHVDNDTGETIQQVVDYEYENETYSYSPSTTLKFNSTHNYRVVSDYNKTLSGTVGKVDLTLTFKYVGPRLITVQHINQDTKAVLSTSSEFMYDGELYNYVPKKDIAFNADFMYQVFSSTTPRGTVAGQPVTVKFYYTPPRKVVTEHINKDNNQVLSTSSEYIHDGKTYTYSPKTDIVYNKDFMYQTVSDATQTGKIAKQPVTVKFYYTPPRTITIRHLDDRDNHVIASSSEMKHDQQTYSYSPRTDLTFDSKYLYTPLTGTQTGTVSGKNIAIDFVYDLPNADLSVNKIQIFTAKADTDLPVKLTFTVASLGDSWSADKATIGLYNKQSGARVASKEFTLDQLSKGIDMTIPAATLDVNANTVYEARIDKVDPLAVVVDPNKDAIDTKGYTSSEKDIIVSADDTDKLTYEGIIMTERTLGQSIKSYKETLTIPINSFDPAATGYGLDVTHDITYMNELGNLSPIDTIFTVDKDLVDSFVEPVETRSTTATLAMEVGNKQTSDNVLTQESRLPKVYIEDLTGNLFSQSQKDKGGVDDYTIKEELIDGGHKLYIPVWLDDLGDYETHLQSKNTIGANAVTFDIENTIDIYAYMFGTIDSKTVKKDALIIQPKADKDFELFNDRN